MEIKKLSETVKGAGKYILYGPSGSGKTHTLSTLPPKSLILAVEKGLRTLVDIAPDIDVVEIDSVADVRGVYEYLKTNPVQYDYVAIDSLTELGSIALNEAKANSKDGRKHYMEMADKITAIIKSFEELPQTIIFIAQEERVNAEDAGLLDYVIAPSFPGRKFAATVPYRIDFVFCLRTRVDESGELSRRFQTGPNGDYLAKARTEKLQLFEEANWTHIFDKLNKEVE